MTKSWFCGAVSRDVLRLTSALTLRTCTHPQLFDKDVVNNAVIWSPAVRNAMDSRALSSDLLKVCVGCGALCCQGWWRLVLPPC